MSWTVTTAGRPTFFWTGMALNGLEATLNRLPNPNVVVVVLTGCRAVGAGLVNTGEKALMSIKVGTVGGSKFFVDSVCVVVVATVVVVVVVVVVGVVVVVVVAVVVLVVGVVGGSLEAAGSNNGLLTIRTASSNLSSSTAGASVVVVVVVVGLRLRLVKNGLGLRRNGLLAPVVACGASDTSSTVSSTSDVSSLSSAVVILGLGLNRLLGELKREGRLPGGLLRLAASVTAASEVEASVTAAASAASISFSFS